MKKAFVFLFTLIILIVSSAGTVYAADYGYEYPDYVPVSGGAYIEAQSSLGTVSLVFPTDYKDGYFGFVDSGTASVGNISDNTIYGTVYTRSGQSYSVRAAYGELIEYQTNSGYPYNQWIDLNMSEIMNTNIQLIDLTGQGRQTDFQKYEFSPEEIFLFSEIAVCTFVLIVVICMRCRNGNY